MSPGFDLRRTATDAAIAFAVFAGLYAVAFAASFPPAQIPGYLLLVAFGALEAAALPPLPSSLAYEAAFWSYVACLAVVSGVLAGRVRKRTARPGGLVPAVAAALLVVGLLALVLVAVVFLPNARDLVPP